MTIPATISACEFAPGVVDPAVAGAVAGGATVGLDVVVGLGVGAGVVPVDAGAGVGVGCGTVG